jgi:hypothetical protein
MKRPASGRSRLGRVALVIGACGAAAAVAGWSNEPVRRASVLVIITAMLLGVVTWAWGEWNARARTRRDTPERGIATFRAITLTIFTVGLVVAWSGFGPSILHGPDEPSTLAFDRVVGIVGITNGLLYLVVWARHVRLLHGRWTRTYATMLAAGVAFGICMVLPGLLGVTTTTDALVLQLGGRWLQMGWILALSGPFSEAALRRDA